MKSVVSVIQQKGGVGKTSLAVNLGYEIKRKHPDLYVVIADADPQQSASKWIARGLQNGFDELKSVDISGHDNSSKHLKKKLSEIKADLIIVDLPPAMESLSLRAALYSDLMLVPVGASALDIEAAEPAIDVCKEAQDLDQAKQFLIVPSKIRSSTAAGKEIRMVLEELGPLAETSIGLRQAFADASTSGEGIGTFAPKSKAHQEIQSLTNQVIKLLNN